MKRSQTWITAVLILCASFIGFSAHAAVSLAAPSISKSFTPAGNGTWTLTLTLTNPNGTAITGATVTDTYPSGLSNATPANGATTCGGAVTANNGGTSVGLTGGTIPANGSCTVTVLVTTAGGSYSNTIPIGGLTSANAVPSAAAASAILIANAGAPTLSGWALLLLSLTLAFVALAALKQH